MKRLVVLALMAGLCLTPGPLAGAAGDMPGPDAQALWVYITQTDPYKNWRAWPDYEGVQPARGPHKPLNRVFVNGRGLSSQKPPANFGTIEVKETLTQEMQLRNITVQYKIEGYNPDDGDWFWAMYDPDGAVKMAGKLDGCIGCHASAKDNDYILAHKF